MKKFSFSELILSALLAFVMVTSASAAGTKTYKPPKPAPTPQPTVISNVGPTSITVSDEKGTRAYTITQFTEISVNGLRATAAELKPGMTVTVTMGTDPTRASRIVAADAPKPGKKK